MNTTIDKQELIDWINELEDQKTLERIKILKENSEPISWDDLPKEVKAGIRRGEEDIRAGRIYSSEEFWANIQEWRKKQNI